MRHRRTGGLELASNYDFDVIILDVMMPKMDGYELAKRLRSQKIATPVLMLTARDSVPDIVYGLDVGADDYLTKPFSFNELLARLRAVKRRARVPQPLLLQVGDLVLDPATREVSRGRNEDFTHADRIQFVGTAYLPCGNGGASAIPDRIESGVSTGTLRTTPSMSLCACCAARFKTTRGRN